MPAKSSEPNDQPAEEPHYHGHRERLRDRSLSAQFEHSVGVTATGVEIFTLSQRHGEKPPA